MHEWLREVVMADKGWGDGTDGSAHPFPTVIRNNNFKMEEQMENCIKPNNPNTFMPVIWQLVLKQSIFCV